MSYKTRLDRITHKPDLLGKLRAFVDSFLNKTINIPDQIFTTFF